MWSTQPEVGQLRRLWEETAKACEELYSKNRIYHLHTYWFCIHLQPSCANLWLEQSHICKKTNQKYKIRAMAQEVVPLKLKLTSVACCCLSSMCFGNKQQILFCVSWSSSLLSHPNRLCGMTAEYPSGRFREFWWEKGYLSVCFNFPGIDVIISSVISKHWLVLFISPALESSCWTFLMKVYAEFC